MNGLRYRPFRVTRHRTFVTNSIDRDTVLMTYRNLRRDGVDVEGARHYVGLLLSIGTRCVKVDDPWG